MAVNGVDGTDTGEVTGSLGAERLGSGGDMGRITTGSRAEMGSKVSRCQR